MNDVPQAKRLEELLERYVEQRVLHGVSPDPAALCRDSPELLGPLREQIRRYERLNRVLAAPGDLEPGQKLLHYRILDKLGEGGMGQVWAAEDEKLGRRVALKLLPPEMAGDRERLERFRREARTVAGLNHPHIVTLHAVEESRGLHFLVMELLEGPTLDQRIGEAGMPVVELFEVAIPVAEALAAAHKRGIVHRDLKPTNVMVTEDGLVKVLDFGLAKLTQDGGVDSTSREPTDLLTGAGRILGTFPYISPEQLQGDPVDARSDIFSFGVLLYEMATGQRPFQARTLAALTTAILVHDPRPATELRPELPALLGRIIERCLEKEPQWRYQTAVDLGRALAESSQRQASSELGELPAAESSKALKRIVVLPFENLGPPEHEYFAAGMTEEITGLLATVGKLGVISRFTALKLRDGGQTIQQIGEELGIDYVLEGTVRWASSGSGPSRIRVTLQLIRVATDTHLWSNVFDRVIGDVFQVQSEIAGEVARQLDVSLLQSEALGAKPTHNMEAYRAYLRGLDAEKRTGALEVDYRLAIRLFEKAVKLDPTFALAFAHLSESRSCLVREGFARSERGVTQARKAAERALELQPDLPRAHLALGHFYYWTARDYEMALVEYEIARRGLPNDSVLLWEVSCIRRRQGRFEESVADLQRALELNPLEPDLSYGLGLTYSCLRRYEEASHFLDRALTLLPDSWKMLLVKVYNQFLWTGDTQLAIEELEAVSNAGHHHAQFYLGYFETCARLYQRAVERYSSLPLETFVDSINYTPKQLALANVYHFMGDAEEARNGYESARRLLEEAARKRPEDSRIRSALGLSYAGLARKADAIREGELGVALLPIKRDALEGPFRLLSLAEIYALLGEHDAALKQIELALSRPTYPFSVPVLETHPVFDPLRDHRRYRALVKRHREAHRRPEGQELGDAEEA